jgi:hypothetical protein
MEDLASPAGGLEPSSGRRSTNYALFSWTGSAGRIMVADHGRGSSVQKNLAFFGVPARQDGDIYTW